MLEKEEDYGPLAFLIGSWEGKKGEDRAPAPDRGVENNKFREEMHFEKIGSVKNHEQLLYGLRYRTTAWEEGCKDPFHEELGYWLWDAANEQVLRCFIVPRGVNITAGATVKNNAKSFDLIAESGSETYGITSNKFLEKEFKVVRYELNITQNNQDSFSYEEDTQIKMKGKDELFHHIDKNTMLRMKI